MIAGTAGPSNHVRREADFLENVAYPTRCGLVCHLDLSTDEARGCVRTKLALQLGLRQLVNSLPGNISDVPVADVLIACVVSWDSHKTVHYAYVAVASGQAGRCSTN